MNKLIIDNRTELTDLDTIELVKVVVEGGRISNNDKQYCYLTSMNYKGKMYMVSANLNKKSERFVITNYFRNDETN